MGAGSLGGVAQRFTPPPIAYMPMALCMFGGWLCINSASQHCESIRFAATARIAGAAQHTHIAAGIRATSGQRSNVIHRQVCCCMRLPPPPWAPVTVFGSVLYQYLCSDSAIGTVITSLARAAANRITLCLTLRHELSLVVITAARIRRKSTTAQARTPRHWAPSRRRDTQRYAASADGKAP